MSLADALCGSALVNASNPAGETVTFELYGRPGVAGTGGIHAYDGDTMGAGGRWLGWVNDAGVLTRGNEHPRGDRPAAVLQWALDVLAGRQACGDGYAVSVQRRAVRPP